MPGKKESYSNLTVENIIEAYYKHVRKDFKIQNL